MASSTIPAVQPKPNCRIKKLLQKACDCLRIVTLEAANHLSVEYSTHCSIPRSFLGYWYEEETQSVLCNLPRWWGRGEEKSNVGTPRVCASPGTLLHIDLYLSRASWT